MATEVTPLVGGKLDVKLEEGPPEDSDETMLESRCSFCLERSKPFVFGGFEGIATSLAIVSGAAGGDVSWEVVLVLGLAAILANSLSLGITEFFSSKAHREFLKEERRREQWSFKCFREESMQGMIRKFESKGMSRKHAEEVVDVVANYEDIFVNLTLAVEQGMHFPDEENDSVAVFYDALIMCVSFAVCAMIPIGIYCLQPWHLLSKEMLYILSVAVSLMGMTSLAVMKSAISSAATLYVFIEAVCVAVICSGGAYAIGLGASFLIGW